MNPPKFTPKFSANSPSVARTSGLPSTAPRKVLPPKSGDSKLQDAEAARKAETLNPTGGANMVAELQDAPERAKAEGRDPAASEAALARLASVCELLESQNKSLMDRLVRLEGANKLLAPMPVLRCPTCECAIKDKQTGRGICEGVHVRVRVVPNETRIMKHFQGVTINGENYRGWCLLPPAMANQVMSAVHRWQAAELNLQLDKGFNFQDRTSGSRNNANIGSLPIIAS